MTRWIAAHRDAITLAALAAPALFAGWWIFVALMDAAVAAGTRWILS